MHGNCHCVFEHVAACFNAPDPVLFDYYVTISVTVKACNLEEAIEVAEQGIHAELYPLNDIQAERA